MKFLHIIMLVSLLSRAQAQQNTAQTQLAQLTTGTSSSGALRVEKSGETYLELEKSRKASWYVSTDTRTLQTSVVFLDSNQRVVYEEVLPRQSVELTSHNRRVLDHALVKLTKRQLVGDKLKTRPIWYKSQGQGMPVPEYKAELPEDTPKLYPTGTLAKVMVSEKKLLYVWCQTPAIEKVNFILQDDMGRVLKTSSVKNTQFSEAYPLAFLPSGKYEVHLYGKTWQKYYEIQVDKEQQQIRVVPLSQ